jgi:hypothetical protein
MKVIQNTGVQGIQVIIKTPGGGEYEYLSPRSSVVVPDNGISEQVETLHKQRVIKVSDYKG